MANTLYHDRAEGLRRRVTAISSAMKVVDNSELDLAPEVNRIEVSQAPLPGIAGGTFDGEALFRDDGQIVILGVRQSGPDSASQLLVRGDGNLLKVTERRYPKGTMLSITVTAVFTTAGDLIRYEESF